MSSEAIRKAFREFFENRRHAIKSSASLIPDDPSVLLTTAGMQQFKRYFTGELNAQKDFGSLNTASIQKSFRTSDIDEVGDETHLTFFEMLGNFSFGGYWKDKAIEYGYEFITKEMGLEIDYVTVFDPAQVAEGDWRKGVPFDEESYKIWQKFLPKEKIRKFGIDNFWGPTGNEGPCGPTTEIYIRGMEIWNIVFNQFYRDSSNKLTPLKIQGVDTGMGLERLAMVAQGKKNIFETDLFSSHDIMPTIINEKVRRIILDHTRAVAFLIGDGVRPSNKQEGYILRRLIRRAMAHFHNVARGSFVGNDIIGLDFVDIENLLLEVVKKYKNVYPELKEDVILTVFREENSKFRHAINAGVRELKKVDAVDALTAFRLYESFGLTFEIIKDFGGEKADNLKRKDFDVEFRKHQEISRAGQEKKFGGHGLLLDTGELKAKDEAELKKVTRLHTATHLLQAALRKVLGEEVKQMGSDITVERTRFDFTFPRKLTGEEIKKVEILVNEAIEKDLPMQYKEMPIEEAKKTGALYFFSARGGEKYPERVKVYYAGKSLEDAFSKEFCGGPHVAHTGEIGKFKIAKEEAVAAGVRRIRAIVEP